MSTHTGDDQKPVLMRSCDPEIHFNFDNIVHRLFSKFWVDNAPSFLTGLGIFGTFLGLAAGIFLAHEKINMQDIQQIRLGLGDLLGGASLAFLTSLAGLATSLSYTIVRSRVYRSIASNLIAINAVFRANTVLYTAEHKRQESLDAISGQLADIVRYTRNAYLFQHNTYTKEMKPAIEKHVSIMDEQLAMVKSFSDQFINDLGDLLSEKMGEQLVPHLSDTVEVLRDIKGERRDTNIEILETMTMDFRKSLTGAAGIESQQLSERLGGWIHHSLERSPRLMTEAGPAQFAGRDAEHGTFHPVIHRRYHAYKVAECAGRYRCIDESHRHATKRPAPSARAAEFSTLNDTEKKVLESVSHVGELAESFDDLMVSSEMLEKSSGLTRELDGLHTKFNTSGQMITDSSQSLSQVSAAMLTLMTGTSDLIELLNTISENGTALQQKLGGLWSTYPGKFDQVDKNLQDVFRVLNEGIAGFTQKVQEYMIELDKHLGRALTELHGFVDELQGTLEDLTEIINDQAKKSES